MIQFFSSSFTVIHLDLQVSFFFFSNPMSVREMRKTTFVRVFVRVNGSGCGDHVHPHDPRECLVLCISLFTKGFHKHLSFTAASRELEIFGLVEARLETEHFNSELIYPLFHITWCVNILCMWFCMYTHMLTALPFKIVKQAHFQMISKQCNSENLKPPLTSIFCYFIRPSDLEGED